MSVISIPKILNDRLTEAGAKAFVEIIEKVEESTTNATLQMAAERFEARLAKSSSELRTEMAELRADLRGEMAELRAELRTEMAALRSDLTSAIVTQGSELRTEIARSQTTTIRWVVGAAFAQIAVILSVMAILFK